MKSNLMIYNPLIVLNTTTDGYHDILFKDIINIKGVKWKWNGKYYE